MVQKFAESFKELFEGSRPSANDWLWRNACQSSRCPDVTSRGTAPLAAARRVRVVRLPDSPVSQLSTRMQVRTAGRSGAGRSCGCDSSWVRWTLMG
jgi:hypothetical protein